MWQKVTNEELPAGDQLPFWSDLVSRELAPLSLRHASSGKEGFPSRASLLELGDVRVAVFDCPPAHLRRTWSDIRRSDPGMYQLILVSGAPLWISQRRQESGLVSGDMVLWDISQPHEGAVADLGVRHRSVILQLPREKLPLPPRKVERIVARPLPARTGMGAILARFMSTLDAYGPGCRPRELDRLGATALDLAGASLAQHLDAYAELPAETRRRAMLARIDAFIEHNLGDPDLSPAGIAAYHHISVRSLHALFQDEGETVAASVRRRRLERCREDLADPRLRRRSIGAVSARWGYLRPADFSRAFRAAYGVSPREFRRDAAPDDN